MISSTAYDTLRGILVLPCGRTLQDYTHVIKAGVGVQADVTKQLLSMSKMDTLEDYQKYMTLVFDEMNIKEGIVYDKNECKVVGFVDVGGINNKLCLFEESLTAHDDDHSKIPLVAKHMLVFMVRGVFIKLQFPYAQYPTRDLTADVLFSLVWEVIHSLEAAGYKVISLTGDKGSYNTKFFRLHNKIAKSEVTYKVPNPYTSEKRDIYFISDVPHLIRTVRNCWSNSFCHNQARALWVRCHDHANNIQCHVAICSFALIALTVCFVDQRTTHQLGTLKCLYNKKSTSGLHLLPKLTYEHIYLNSYSRMRVYLATQVKLYLIQKHPECKKGAAKNLKKGRDEKELKSK